MGLAASQARWIALAARKSNVEYEGQQINQARTALANQSADLWNQLYDMAVPTAPNKNDFTSVQYTFESGDDAHAITDIKDANYTDVDGITYNSYITYTSEITEYKGIRDTRNNPQVIRTASGYMVGTKTLQCLDAVDQDEGSQVSPWNAYRASLDQIAEDWPNTQLAKDWLDYKNTGNAAALSNIYYWTDSNNQTNFTSAVGTSNDSLEECFNDTTLALHTYYADYQETNKSLSKYAIVEYDPNGRATSLQMEGSSIVYSLNTETVSDETAYNDAMNEYNYEQQVYEKKVQDINAKTEQIQTEDRTLELRLKALDTEQNSLQTEMDAVHKIISKNIESTFKTFEG
ncbi:MAG: hypothetical protein E7Z87_03325 [Cyanobacteria bacterium SIG26]|nr:hypothetical protein [Cyanobacteria bacterium SIG26]